MNTSQFRPLDREAAEQLLDRAAAGSARPDDPLARLLTAVAAPGHDGELAGEDLAVAAFTAAQLTPSPGTGGREQARPGHAKAGVSRFARHLGFRALGVAAALGGVGVALAAATGVFSGSTPSHPGIASTGGSRVSASQGAAPSPARTAASAPGRATPGSSGTATPGSTPAAPVTKLSGLCTEVAGHVAALEGDTAAAMGQTLSATGLEQALASPTVSSVLTSPVFASLTSVAGAATNVPDYCALVLRLPALPQPSLVSGLPRVALAGLPVSLLEQLPASVLAKLPAWRLAGLPASTLAKLPASVLATLPATTLATLPTSVLATLPPSVLAKLPPSVLGTLPSSVLGHLPAAIQSELGLG